MKKKGLSLLTALLFFSSAMWATDPDYLSFTVTGSGTGTKFYMKKTGTPNALNLQYSKDNKATWQDVPNVSASAYTIASGATIYVRTKNATQETVGYKDASNYWAFNLTNQSVNDTIVISGNIMSLLDQSCQSTTLTDHVFCNLFAGNTSTKGGAKIGDLKLPATTLSKGCYQNMFCNFKALRSGGLPALPATTLAEDCYREMFRSVGNLQIAIPANYLPAQSLAKGCYRDMFMATGFTSAPALPATELAESCYRGMFASAKFSELPALPATELAPYCYDSMFYNVNANLTSIPKDYLPAMVMKEGCYMQMFKNCSKVTQFPNLPATTLAKDCYKMMFASVFTSVNVAVGGILIDLPATELVEGCYSQMFTGDVLLAGSISVHFTSWGDGSYTTDWLPVLWGSANFYGPQALIDELATEGRSTSTVPNKWLVNDISSGVSSAFVLGDAISTDKYINIVKNYLSPNLNKVQDIQLVRTFQAGMWNTIYLPFALNASQIAAAFGAGTKVGSLIRGETVEDELFLDFSTNVTAMEAGQPYIIFPGANANVVNPTFESVTITTTDTTDAGRLYVGDVTFTGVFLPTADLKKTDYFLGANNTIHSTESGTLNGFRAYFSWMGNTTPDAGGEASEETMFDAPRRVHMSINGTETVTADEQLQMNEATSTKMMVNGQLVIMRDGIRYNAQGQVIE